MPERRQLWLLIALVLALHGLALLGQPLRAAQPERKPLPVFQTRRVEVPAPAPAAPVEPVAPAKPPPAKPKPPKPRPKAAPPPPAPVVETAAAAPEPVVEASVAVMQASHSAEAIEAVTEVDVVESTPQALPEPEPAPEEAVVIAKADTPSAAQPQLPPVRLPPSTLLSFDVQGQAKKLHYNASAELLWQHDGGRYQARQQVKVFLIGSRVQTSAGMLTEHGLRPVRFGDKSRSEKAAHFDYDKGEVIFSSSTDRPALPNGAQDRLSVFIQLGAMLAAAPQRYPQGAQIALPTVGTRSIDPWIFTVEGEETLDLPIGPTPALRLQRVPRKQWDQRAELWLGRGLDYLPVRIRLTQENGDFVDLLLTGHAPP